MGEAPEAYAVIGWALLKAEREWQIAEELDAGRFKAI
jgi:hypothetical protein